MTESLKSGSTGTGNIKSDKEALKEEKKKVKVLKNALKDARKAQETQESELKQALQKIELLNAQMQEKVNLFILDFAPCPAPLPDPIRLPPNFAPIGKTLPGPIPRKDGSGGNYHQGSPK